MKTDRELRHIYAEGWDGDSDRDAKDAALRAVYDAGRADQRQRDAEIARGMAGPMPLPKRLRIKAGMIHMGESIAWGSDVALMLEAADTLERLHAVGEHIAAAIEREEQ